MTAPALSPSVRAAIAAVRKARDRADEAIPAAAEETAFDPPRVKANIQALVAAERAARDTAESLHSALDTYRRLLVVASFSPTSSAASAQVKARPGRY